jgi:hypothetical protein
MPECDAGYFEYRMVIRKGDLKYVIGCGPKTDNAAKMPIRGAAP